MEQGCFHTKISYGNNGPGVGVRVVNAFDSLAPTTITWPFRKETAELVYDAAIATALFTDAGILARLLVFNPQPITLPVLSNAKEYWRPAETATTF